MSQGHKDTRTQGRPILLTLPFPPAAPLPPLLPVCKGQEPAGTEAGELHGETFRVLASRSIQLTEAAPSSSWSSRLLLWLHLEAAASPGGEWGVGQRV